MMQKISDQRIAKILGINELDIQWTLFDSQKITVKVRGTVNPRQISEQDLNRLPV